MLVVQSNLARTYEKLGRSEQALHLKRDVYSGFFKLYGAGNTRTLMAANNYALSLLSLKCYGELRH